MECLCPILDRATEVEPTQYSRDAWSVVRCRETGLVFLANPPDYSELEQTFAWEDTSWAVRRRRATEEPLISRISGAAKRAKMALFPKRNKIASIACAVAKDYSRTAPLRVLDVGCGEAYLLVELHQRLSARGHQVELYGIEISKQLAALSAKHVAEFGGEIVFANAIDGAAQLAHRDMQLIVMASFLEHECRPLSLLRQLHQVLAPDGAIILKVPNFDCLNRTLRGRKWCGLRYPEHVNYFTPGTLLRLAEEAGYIVSRQTFLDRFPLSDNMYAVLRKRP